MTKRISVISIILVCVFMLPLSLYARKKNEKKEEKKEKTAYEKLVGESAKSARGMMNLYMKKGKLLVEIPLKLMGEKLLLASTVSKVSDPVDVVPGEKANDPLQIRFSLQDSLVYLKEVMAHTISDHDPEIARAIEQSYMDPTKRIFPVKAWTPDSSAVVIDMSDFFKKNVPCIAPFTPKFSLSFIKRTDKFIDDMSTIDEIKAFPQNVIIKSSLNYSLKFTFLGMPLVEDYAYTLQVTRSIVRLPQEKMPIRYADPRIGYFQTQQNLFSAKEQGVQKRYYVKRWRLEPSDEAAYWKGEVVEPKQPIVFYIDKAMPEAWKPYIEQGILDWNVAFERIGFRNAVVVKDYPENDSTFDPDDIRYSCVRYATSSVANAMGPSWCDPRTGEIFNATVHLYHNVTKLVRQWRFVQTAQLDEQVRKRVLNEKILGESLRYIVAHECGHCLGLMHNMAASAAIPTDSLRSATYTGKYGTTMSIMDYARYNYVAQPEDKRVALTPPQMGLYDFYAIRWGYQPIRNVRTPEEERDTLNQWIREKAGDPRYRYGKQEIFSPYDLTSYNESLSDNMIKANAYGIKNLKYIVSHLLEWTAEKDKDYSFSAEMYEGIISQWKIYLAQVQSYLGGYILNENVFGDGIPACRPVSRQQQKEALQFIYAQLREASWLVDPELNRQFLMKPWLAEDARLLFIDRLLGAETFERIANCESLSEDPYTTEEYADDLFALVWASTLKGKLPTADERLMQTMFVKRLLGTAGYLSKESPRYTSIADREVAEWVRAIQTDPAYVRQLNGSQLLKLSTVTQVTPEVSGFELLRNFSSKKGGKNNYLYFDLLNRTKSLLAQRKQVADQATRKHYAYLLYEIGNAMKNSPEKGR